MWLIEAIPSVVFLILCIWFFPIYLGLLLTLCQYGKEHIFLEASYWDSVKNMIILFFGVFMYIAMVFFCVYEGLIK